MKVVFFIALAMTLGACVDGVDSNKSDKGAIIEIASGDVRHIFYVEIADDDAERAKGLMFRESLSRDSGMLFIFDAPKQASMWMKNTYLTLDMAFIAADGRIVNVAHKTTPHSLDEVRSTREVLGVLEVNGGVFNELGISAGDLVVHSAFGSQADASFQD